MPDTGKQEQQGGPIEFDHAGIDFRQWFEWKNQSAIYFLCLTHNLMTLMEEQIRQRSGVINQAEFNRKAKTRAASAAAKPSSSRTDTRPVHHAVERLTQRTVKFIRWLKNHLDLERHWGQAIARLNEVYAHL